MNVVDHCIQALGSIIKGKDEELRLAMCCLLARGHLLIEDLPGMGKTTLAHCLAGVTGLEYRRIQFTSDLLPADIIGVSVFDKASSTFRFKQGPLFSQLVLADEINRASPRTQSALLEAMEERQVSTEGVSRPLSEPFFVIATQNPGSQEGTFSLPESQLDRFLMRIHLGYPDPGSERAILKGEAGRSGIDRLGQVITAAALLELQKTVSEIHTGDLLLDYVLRLVSASREAGHFRAGLSPRAGLSLLEAAKAWALIHGRDYVIPEDVQAVFLPVASHRLQPKEQGISAQELLANIDVMA